LRLWIKQSSARNRDYFTLRNSDEPRLIGFHGCVFMADQLIATPSRQPSPHASRLWSFSQPRDTANLLRLTLHQLRQNQPAKTEQTDGNGGE
jgi:hypothetical protein